jgi:hypothetical protein|tara:strand:+ start:354 stop:557 length:204 start_codon:yes stop_codon:yes gene_type:complete
MDIDKIISIVKSLREEAVMAAPTNNVGAGKIAGTREAGDDPPVRKKKRYIYSGRGSRRMWLTNKKDG